MPACGEAEEDGIEMDVPDIISAPGAPHIPAPSLDEVDVRPAARCCRLAHCEHPRPSFLSVASDTAGELTSRMSSSNFHLEPLDVRVLAHPLSRHLS